MNFRFILYCQGFPSCFCLWPPAWLLGLQNLPSLLVYSILLDWLFWENYPPARLFHPVRLLDRWVISQIFRPYLEILSKLVWLGGRPGGNLPCPQTFRHPWNCIEFYKFAYSGKSNSVILSQSQMVCLKCHFKII